MTEIYQKAVDLFKFTSKTPALSQMDILSLLYYQCLKTLTSVISLVELFYIKF